LTSTLALHAPAFAPVQLSRAALPRLCATRNDAGPNAPLPKAVLPLTAAVFTQLLGEGIAISTLPLHMKGMGASAPMVGVATSCFAAMQMVCGPIAVKASSRVGRQRMLRTCLLGATAGQLLIGISPNVWGILVGRLMGGIFAASVPIAQAGVTDIVPPAQAALALSRVSAASQMAVVVGPMASAGGAALFALIGVPAHLRVRAVFLASAVFASLVFALNRKMAEAVPSPPSVPPAPPAAAPVVSWFDSGERLTAESTAAKVAKAVLPKPVGNVPLPGTAAIRDADRLAQLMLRAVALTVGWSLTLCVSTYCLFGSTFLGYAQPQLSATFSAGAAFTVLTQLAIFPRLVKRVGEHVACAMGLTLLSCGLGGAALLKAQPFHSALYLACRIGSGVADTSTATLVARSSRGSEDRAKNLALIQSTRAGARIITPVLSAWLFARSVHFAWAPGALPYLLVASILIALIPVPLILRRFEETDEQ